MVELKKTLNLYNCIEIIKNSSDGLNALNFVKEISKFHRVQASKGYRDAAKSAAKILKNNGLEVSIHSYPADGKTLYFTQKIFKEWNCKEAWLKITSPWEEYLSDFNREEMSVIQRSTSKDFSNKDIPITYIEDNVLPEDFHDSLEDTLLFVENGFEKWFHHAIELGALGIITVSIPEIKPVRINMSEDREMANSHANLNFHLYNEDEENKLCGFAISPLSGKRLREACINMKYEGKKPTARFKVDAKLEEGFIENVEAIIPGETDEEILMVSHLCHPKSSVNDNASGVASAMEAMCNLQRLIKDGTLPIPKRTIRLLLIPEFTGTYSFLKENEKKILNIVGGINIDMVGAYQNGKAGPLIIVDTPDSAHSFSGDLSSLIMEELSKECAFGGEDIYVPLFLGIKVPFVFGSDHYILSDPSIDIPSVALTQWPDKTYHTSSDNIEHIDPGMLRRSAALGAAYCYIYSRFNLEDGKKIISKVSSRFFNLLINSRNKEESIDDKGYFKYMQDLYFSTLQRVASLFKERELVQILEIIEEEKKLFIQMKEIFSRENREYIEKSSLSSPVPTRLFKAPLAMKSIIGDMEYDEKEKFYSFRSMYPGFTSLDDYIIYETDGQKSIEEIGKIVYFQTGIKCDEYVKEFFKVFSDIGLIDIG